MPVPYLYFAKKGKGKAKELLQYYPIYYVQMLRNLALRMLKNLLDLKVVLLYL
jgi:hypothetical protein